MEIKIEELFRLLPEGYEKACWDTKAMERPRKIKSPTELLQLILYYLYGAALVEIGPYAQQCGMESISDVGFMGRFQKSTAWLQWLTEHCLPNAAAHYQKPAELENYRVLAVDASNVCTHGAVEKIWRLHFALDLFTLNCQQFQLTEQSTGERLQNFTLQENDLVLGDRAYATIQGMEYCRQQKSHFILRIRNKAFQLYQKKEETEEMEPFVLTQWLETVGETAEEITLYYQSGQKEYQPIRFCAIKKPEEAIAQEEKKLKRKESKKQEKLSEETKFTHRYLFVVTSLPAAISAQAILSCYRLRWQVEMVFKRYKSLLGLGSIPVQTTESCRAWLQGKMLIALLIEKFLGNVDFSPSGGGASQPQYLERDEVSLSFAVKPAPLAHNPPN